MNDTPSVGRSVRERYFKSVPTQAAGARDRAFPPPSLSSPFCFPVPPPPPLPIVPPPLTRPSVRPSDPGHRSRISSTTWSSSAFGRRRRRRRRARGFQKYSGGRRGAGEGGQLDGCMGGHTYVRRVVLHCMGKVEKEEEESSYFSQAAAARRSERARGSKGQSDLCASGRAGAHRAFFFSSFSGSGFFSWAKRPSP